METSEAKKAKAYFYAEMVKETHLNGYAANETGFRIETMSVFDYVLNSFERGRFYAVERGKGLGIFIAKTGRGTIECANMEEAEDEMFASALNAFENESTPKWCFSRENCIECIAEHSGATLADASLLADGELIFVIGEEVEHERKDGTIYLTFDNHVLETGSLNDALAHMSKNASRCIPTELKRFVSGEIQEWKREHFTDASHKTLLKFYGNDPFDECESAWMIVE